MFVRRQNSDGAPMQQGDMRMSSNGNVSQPNKPAIPDVESYPKERT